MLVGAGDVPAPLLLAGNAASGAFECAAGENAIRTGLRVPAGAVIRRREGGTSIAVLIDRAIIEAKIVARDIAEGAFFISGLEPELVARREKIGIQLNAALDREAIVIAGRGREGIGGRGSRCCRRSRRRGERARPEKAGVVLMGSRRQLH